jgi:putative tryptophan/tyrosine transport system substrate-binding protein
MNLDTSMGGKWVEVLKELNPHVQRIGLMFNPNKAPLVGKYYRDAFEAAAASLAVEPISIAVHQRVGL